MNRTITIVAILLVVIAAVSYGQLTDDALGKPGSVTLSGTSNQVTLYGSSNVVQVKAYSSCRSTYGNASTSAVVHTALSGRDYIEFVNLVDTHDLYVGVGYATATAAHAKTATVKYGQPLKIPADDGVIFSTIATGAFAFQILEYAY